MWSHWAEIKRKPGCYWVLLVEPRKTGWWALNTQKIPWKRQMASQAAQIIWTLILMWTCPPNMYMLLPRRKGNEKEKKVNVKVKSRIPAPEYIWNGWKRLAGKIASDSMTENIISITWEILIWIFNLAVLWKHLLSNLIVPWVFLIIKMPFFVRTERLFTSYYGISKQNRVIKMQ